MKSTSTTDPKRAGLPLIVIMAGLLHFIAGSWLALSEPVNTEHYVHFLLDAPPLVYWLIDIAVWTGPLLFLTGILMLILRIRKNDETIHRG